MTVIVAALAAAALGSCADAGPDEAVPAAPATTSAAGAVPSASARAATPDQNSPTYLALGDSLAAGVGAPPGEGYVDRLHQELSEQVPGLELVSLGVSGETTETMLAPGGQLDRAEDVLRSADVRLVTIDIGANDGLGCALVQDPACLDDAAATVESNLGVILDRLRTATTGGQVVGMDYYLPAPAQLQDDPARLDAALGLLSRLNDTLAQTYASYGVPVAPVSAAFGGEDPARVAELTCVYTAICETPADIHPTAEGHAVIAETFLAVTAEVG